MPLFDIRYFDGQYTLHDLSRRSIFELLFFMGEDTPDLNTDRLDIQEGIIEFVKKCNDLGGVYIQTDMGVRLMKPGMTVNKIGIFYSLQQKGEIKNEYDY